MSPDTHFADNAGVNIAYQCFGDGPSDLIVIPGWLSNLDLFWEEPMAARFFRALSQFTRVILIDRRGTGLSDRVAPPTLEEQIDDVTAVMKAADSERAALLGYSEGGCMCALFAATYPQRTTSLILIGSYARWVASEDYPVGVPEEEAEQWISEVEEGWGGPVGIGFVAPSLVDDARFRQWLGKFFRSSASKADALALLRMNMGVDLRGILPSIHAPTLVIQATRDLTTSLEVGRDLARRIKRAKFVELDTDDHLPFVGCPDDIIREVRRFIGQETGGEITERVLKTVLFTDIVDSTHLAATMGDVRWHDLLEAHHAAVRHELEIFRGDEVKTTGDGFHATFDGPARAVKCAYAIRESTQELGLSVRAGIHTGECERRGDSLEGLAIHTAARIAAMAAGGEILVSRTVKDLVAGSGIEFEDIGNHSLKGLPDSYQILKVAAV
jgi:pimeloyl-ACP methyl ester carboxylesterase